MLQEASDRNLPLIERLKFIGIYSSNQDEFFKVRVATLKKIVETSKTKDQLFGHKPIKILKQVQSLVLKHIDTYHEVIDDVMNGLAQEGIHFVNEKQLDDTQKAFVTDYFESTVRPNLVPIMLSQVKHFPDLHDQAVYFAIVLKESKGDKGQYALLEIPSRILGRFVRIPDRGNETYLMYLDDVIRTCLPLVFPRFGKWKASAYMIKISRDADMNIDDDLDESYIQKVMDKLNRRRWGEPTRIIYDQSMPKELSRFLINALEAEETDTLIPGGRYHNHRDMMSFPDLGRKDLVHPKFEALDHQDLTNPTSYFHTLKRKDALLYFPYHSYAPVIDLVREAAVDPKVVSIKVTLYRLAKNSRIINALISAAKNAKKVIVVLELQARFDEKANLKWANILKDEGVDVHFGLEGIKIHSKLLLITRHDGAEIEKFAVLSTGNFNESTAKLYTDHALMTAKKGIVEEVEQVFELIHRPYLRSTFRNLWVSPFAMRSKIITHIQNEAKAAQRGQKSWIKLKLNNLADQEVSDELYRASQAGVEIRLIIRGMCSVVPELKGVSENLKAISIVDRFLEHSRVYMFANSGRTICMLSSADWMTRNLDYRVEVAFPIRDPKLKKEVETVLDMQWKDNVKARRVDLAGSNKVSNHESASGLFRSQTEIYDYIASVEQQRKN